jgi:diguanylate cyclase (GGDEF)-like protein
MSEDVTEARQAQAEVFRLAHYDALTGLRNRSSYLDKLHALIASGRPFALLSIDLDRFKGINDQFGHLAGDELLTWFGDRLREIGGSDDFIARVGGDEFAMVVSAPDVANSAQRTANSILAALADPISLGLRTMHLSASIGIASFPSDAGAEETLRQCADLALYRAKDQGRASICFFSAEMDAAARDRRSLEHDLRVAIGAGDIRLAYQPVLSAKTGLVTSVEALARWTHPVRGPIAPDLFIPIAEESGLIQALGRKILFATCEDAMRWPDSIGVAVNVSPLQIHDGDLCRTVKDILAATGLKPARLQIEVTESLFLADVEQTFRELEQLRALGIQVLMDDFGIGYSSLSYFERFRFDKVKIDQSFVGQMLTSRAAEAVIRAEVGLGGSLGMGVVAEGVEQDEQMQALVGIGCTHLQGYLFSPPVPADVIATMVLADTVLGTTRRTCGRPRHSPDIRRDSRPTRA